MSPLELRRKAVALNPDDGALAVVTIGYHRLTRLTRLLLVVMVIMVIRMIWVIWATPMTWET